LIDTERRRLVRYTTRRTISRMAEDAARRNVEPLGELKSRVLASSSARSRTSSSA
jgi:hypothetical protein